MLNSATIIGRLGQDPEGFETSNGRGARLSVATTSYVKGEEKTEWHRVALFGKAADFALDYLSKGRLVCVEGRIETSSYEKGGVKMYSTQIVGFRILGLDKPRSNDDTAAPTAQTSANFDDDVPF
jgi:single-strand DNA-binding protein